VARFQQLAADNTLSGSSGFDLHLSNPPAGQVLDVPHVAMDRPPNPFNIYLSRVYSDPNTGALLNGAVTLFGSRSNGDGTFTELRTDFGTPDAPASHPVARRHDQYVALDQTRGSDADIQTISFPGEAQLTSAPAPITTSAPERMPAWSPGGLQLGFVRTSGGTRKLAIFDLTPGLQTIVNPPIDIGAEPPTAQTRAFQNSWGGLSLAQDVGVRLPTVTCGTSCVSPMQTTLAAVVLAPTVSTTTKTQTIGIFLARVTGRRKVLGRSLPRIKPVGRVPLGATRKGRNRFRWNGRVNGRQLKAGRYLLTYRALRRGRVVSTSGSIRFTVTKGRRIRGARLLR
jgi:hypothetical protein